MKKKITNITINSIGVALFIALSMCLQVPVFENYYLCLGYVVMAVYTYFFGIKSGAIVGSLGTILYCFIINGLRGMPGWAVGNIVIAICLGFGFEMRRKKANNIFLKYLGYVTGICIGCVGGILFVKSIIEWGLYAQPIIVRMANNIYALVADIIVLIISIPICELLNPHAKKYLSKY